MHLLEDHDTQWANATHVGFGLLGNRVPSQFMQNVIDLGLAFAPIKE